MFPRIFSYNIMKMKIGKYVRLNKIQSMWHKINSSSSNSRAWTWIKCNFRWTRLLKKGTPVEYVFGSACVPSLCLLSIISIILCLCMFVRCQSPHDWPIRCRMTAGGWAVLGPDGEEYSSAMHFTQNSFTQNSLTQPSAHFNLPQTLLLFWTYLHDWGSLSDS